MSWFARGFMHGCRNAAWVMGWVLAFAGVAGCCAVAQDVAQHPAAALTVDSDPVAAPPGSAAAPVAQTAPSTGAAPSSGVTGQVQGSNGHYTLQTNAYEVVLNASVVDNKGREVDDLPESAFEVYEDGTPQKIISFKHEDIPVSIGILIDNSGSMYDKTAAVGAAALDLVKLSNPQDEAFLVDFSSEAYIDQDFTSNVLQLQKGLAYIKPSGGTALYDAVIASSDYMTKNAKRAKQVLLIITDGEDDASSASLQSAIRRVQDMNGPSIYCIGLLFGDDVSRSEAHHAKDVLQELSDQTGGLAYFPKSLATVDEIAQEVAHDIRTQYTIVYRSTNPPQNGGYRQIHVEAKEKGYRGLEVRTRSGYFPHPATGSGDSAGNSTGN
jgi:Ca-activated chloride channel family protein